MINENFGSDDFSSFRIAMADAHELGDALGMVEVSSDEASEGEVSVDFSRE